MESIVDNTGTGIYGHRWSNRSPPGGRPEPSTAPMSRKKISTTIYITPEQNDRLKLLHERTKVPIAVYIREGIDMVLKHYEHVLPGQMSLEAAGQKKS
jgi:predicted DNA-binding protein